MSEPLGHAFTETAYKIHIRVIENQNLMLSDCLMIRKRAIMTGTKELIKKGVRIHSVPLADNPPYMLRSKTACTFFDQDRSSSRQTSSFLSTRPGISSLARWIRTSASKM